MAARKTDNLELAPPDNSTRTDRIKSRLKELAQMKDGWLDNEGKAPSKEGLIWLESAMALYYPSDAPKPYIYPTEAGGIQIEWKESGHYFSIEIDLEEKSGYWHDLNTVTDEDYEEVMDLSGAVGWSRLCLLLAENDSDA
ncbi:MAG: hypothetical protein NUW37_11950 [Planctomycetes bacterium]|nr:hypothetical protein [Planctomycetota bacterium]